MPRYGGFVAGIGDAATFGVNKLRGKFISTANVPNFFKWSAHGFLGKVVDSIKLPERIKYRLPRGGVPIAGLEFFIVVICVQQS
jgi:hypothetical protein